MDIAQDFSLRINNSTNKQIRMAVKAMWLFALFLGLIGSKVTAQDSEHFEPSTKVSLQHLIVDSSTGNLYVGATNTIFQLGEDLSLKSSVSTGPHLDNPNCNTFTETEDECKYDGIDYRKTLTDNYNKVLVINPNKANPRLITCGSLFQGTCESRMLHNMSISDEIRQNPMITQPKWFVAANSKEGTTVAFVGQGPENKDVLYVGTSFTEIEIHRINIPLIASRDLSSTSMMGGLLDIAVNNDFPTYGTYHVWGALGARRRQQARVIDYKAGFSVAGFSYFFTVDQMDGGRYESHLTSICQSDNVYHSYMEFPLTCAGSNGTEYNLLQAASYVRVPEDSDVQLRDRARYPYIVVAVFARSAESNEKEPSTESAICVYDLYDIRYKVKDNLAACFEGGNSCDQERSIDAMPDFCGEGLRVTDNLYVLGSLPLRATAVATYAESLLTAITMDTVDNQHLVALLGTGDGKLRKVEIMSKTLVREYGVDVIDEGGAAILPDMPLDANRRHLYIMTQHKVYHVPVERCSASTSCGTCTGLKDPYCGWCSLERRCTRAALCRDASFHHRWLSDANWGCIQIAALTPSSNTATDKQISIRLKVDSLPMLQGNDPGVYICVFGDDDSAPETIGNASGSDLTCPTPEIGAVPRIPAGQDHVTVALGIKYSKTDVIFLQTNFSFYNCGQHDKCSSCAQSQWACKWCIYDNACVATDKTCTQHQSHQSIVQDQQSSKCPRIEHHPDKEILIPVGLDETIRLSAANLPVPRGEGEGYQCQVHSQEPPLTIPARRVDAETLECQASKYSIREAEAGHGIKQESVAVVWQGGYTIEDAYGSTVTLYSCKVMGNDCSKCISLDDRQETKKYNCVWCANSCAYKQCGSSSRSIECPKAQISKVTPLKGPVAGGTLVTIEGSNLGRSFSQIEDAVMVAGVRCDVLENEYEISSRIVCRTRRSPGILTGRISITINSHTAEGQEFSYQEPEMRSMSPSLGPEAGGTLLTITGTSLDAGLSLIITLATGSRENSCIVESLNATTITCRTQKTTPSVVQKVVALFDGNKKELRKEFTFTQNPNITKITPLESPLSGGRQLTIMGTNLISVQRPYMLVHEVTETSDGETSQRRRRSRKRRQAGGSEIRTECSVQDAGTMLCPTPYLAPGNFSLSSSSSDHCTAPSRTEPTTSSYTLGFVMDAVPNLGNLGDTQPDLEAEIKIFRDPIYTVFPETKKYKGETLELQGTNLNLACSEQEVQVTIGKARCEVKTLDSTRLFCKPPPEEPEPEGGGGGHPKVTVRVGNLCQELGELEYVVINPAPENSVWKIALGVVGGFLLLVIVVILAVYKRKSRAAEQQYKAMQLQLDTLESNVRNECKQAFAELQTEVSDFTSDINVIGIPYWDYKTYTFKVLFPSLHDHSVLHTQVTYHTNQFGSLQYNSASKHGYDQGLHQFNQLLNSKQFLLIFIRTLEQQKNFSIRDKAQVASLLMIVLQDKMDYATDILKALLSELIDRYVEKKHPKLMLRRTESVVEKMLTNWLSICMYSYLKQHAGKSLFMLHKAIKHQTEKGVIDAITAEARYSLSEDRLLREKMDPKTINVYLVTDENREPITCKMLDLDTITQAKEKALDAIYMNTPITRRPNVHDVDLVMLATFDKWRSGRSGHLPLQDEDVTTEVVAGWKKVNTLLHYHVPDGATMAIVPSRNKNDGVRNVNGMIELTSPNLSVTTPIMTMEEGTKVWHLVKHDDASHASQEQKVISEIFLTRLLATKGTLQQFIDDLFMTILRVDGAVPPAIKYLFDFLDQAAHRHNIMDPDIVHTWKSNSLPLRFWVNIIKNPEFVFDINKSHIVDSCLSVVAQTFMDACSTSEHRLGKDSPSNKLLFAKDIPRYRSWVAKFYRGIQDLPPVTDQAMQQAMTQLSMSHIADFNVTAALKDLYKYAQQYSFEFLENLDDDPSAKKLHLANKFEQVAAMIDGAQMF